ncbi:MAG: Rqc2 family fibronectin-binding protein [Bacillota bacterium]
MPFDGSVVHSVVNELNNKILNGKVDKIHQPEKDELIISIRGFKENLKLLLSSSPMYPRIHLTDISRSNPMVPPSFCMLLRKHLMGSRIIGINQPDYERIVEIVFECIDELGYSNTKTLIIEIMGRHSNIVFIDNETKKIIDSIKRISFEVSSVREVLPGRTYIYPPAGGKQETPKISPLDVSSDCFVKDITELHTSIKAEKYFLGRYNGISPVIAREVCHNAAVDADTDMKSIDYGSLSNLYYSFGKLFNQAKKHQYVPNIIFENEKPLDFSCFDLTLYSSCQKKYFKSISEAIETFYHEKDKKDRLKQKYGDIQRIISNRLDRSFKKLEKLNEELSQAQSSDKYKIYGELITANMHDISKGQESVRVLNYYSPEGEYVEIPLDSQLTPSANAQKYYKQYSKSKTALKLIDQQLKETKDEILYLESQLDNLEKCTEELEINEIRNELAEQGYISSRKTDKRDKHIKPSKPLHFISSTGVEIYVGKNNIQNDYLTLKLAAPNDIWLHTKEIPGSHVIVKTEGRKIDDATLAEAANLAAYYSKARSSSKVPVDYTIKKNVKKPAGAKPGMVIYENYKTVYIDPIEESIKRLKKSD